MATVWFMLILYVDAAPIIMPTTYDSQGDCISAFKQSVGNNGLRLDFRCIPGPKP